MKQVFTANSFLVLGELNFPSLYDLVFILVFCELYDLVVIVSNSLHEAVVC